jgi:site-specific DNA recombinase
MKRIGIYIRVSTEEQAKIVEGSLVSQRKRLEEYVDGQNRRENNWGAIVSVYVDEGKSAKDMNRPEFQRLLSDVRMGKLDLILASELSRFSRSIRDFCEIWDLLKKHKVSFITLRDNFDSTTAAGEMMIFNIMNYAQYERKQTGERITANFQSRAKRGLWNGGVIPLGYKRDVTNPGKLLVDEEESKTIQMIFDLFLEQKSLHETCRALNSLGYRTKKSQNHYTVQSLHNMLTNSTYLGLREVNKRKSEEGSGELQLVKAQWEAIIDQKIFDRVQKVLEGNRRRFKPMSFKTYAYPLTGIAICGECGARLNGKSAHGKTKKHHYYDHARTLRGNGNGHKHNCRIQRLRAERVEELVLNSLKQILSDPKNAKLAVEAYQKNSNKLSPEWSTQINGVTKEIGSLKKREANLVARVSDLPPEVDANLFYKSIKDIQAQAADKERIKMELEAKQCTYSASQGLTANDVMARVQYAFNRLEDAPKEDQKAVFENIIQFAEFHPNRMRLGLFVGSTTIKNGGERGIRTPEQVALLPVFKTGAINHSTISPPSACCKQVCVQ